MYETFIVIGPIFVIFCGSADTTGVVGSVPEDSFLLVEGKFHVTSERAERKSTTGTAPRPHATSLVKSTPRPPQRKTAACTREINAPAFKYVPTPA